ncbi:selenium metabolism-associated LysR family transcriptional regulator [Anaerobacillus isosaccharinicus]|uniref:Selenium metabolism-associated LysR family transcriptional regulator n=1 Tax=Anaerobacillus isosaccharinicus TaxID=1532552 RepID=A0A7S7L5E5_9BACI|nr:selenium metabolism-associated LysR family transcriptional regulator [Anaerobacillus isosaccharinicus]MBA5587012.1 LysR family transcriptional regulator [Anaerobacillus isosaccharinicus]QOY34787.1 LysR family transcriptional regulator [Anaerobacillus isosaccharinicus]
MNLKRIKTFMMVLDNKSFSTVANLLNISQPAVSKQVKTLEAELGINLLHRETVEPTEAGKVVYQKGKKFLYDWDVLVEECRRLQGELTGVLRIGASSVPGTYIVPSLLREFLNVHPSVDIQLSIHDSGEIPSLLKEGSLDVGFVGSEPIGDELISHIIKKDQFILIGPKDSEEINDLTTIKNLPFIFRSEKSGTWQGVERSLKGLGISTFELRCIAKVKTTEAVISMVEADLGYSVVSSIAATQAMKQNRIKVIKTLPNERNFYLTYSHSKKIHPAIVSLVTLSDSIDVE